MHSKIWINDIKANKGITATITAFIIVASMLISVAFMVTVTLFGAINNSMLIAKTPHFLQMHSGDIDKVRLNQFADNNALVEQYELMEFLNIEGSDIILGSNSLAGSTQDNGFVTQSSNFDFLLDLNNNIITPKEDELYVPICYMDQTQIGDTAVIAGENFVVTGFLRDSQMNATLASSKRFLVNEVDFEKIKAKGKIEYLIEFRVNDMEELVTFESDYVSAGLENNGPTLTYPMIKIINAISDGLMVGILILIAALVIFIALLCVRFTLLAKIESEIREIGVMKAIGITFKEIKTIYLSKYILLAGVGGFFGYVLSFWLKIPLTENINLYMGKADNDGLSLFMGAVGAFLLFLWVILYVNRLLNKFKKISAVETIRGGSVESDTAKLNGLSLYKSRFFSINVSLGIQDVLKRKKLYLTMLFIVIISSFISIVPQNLYHTISQDSFVTYMGVGQCDIRMDIQQTENISEKTEEIQKALLADNSVSDHTILTTKSYAIQKDDGRSGNIKIELGNHEKFPVYYSDGKAPSNQSEIALSHMNADEFSKEVGDTMEITIDGKQIELLVCGIYSDITNGGKTAKADFIDNETQAMWSVIYTELNDPELINSKVLEWQKNFSYAKISDLTQYVNTLFGQTIGVVKMVAILVEIITLTITALIVYMFVKMLIAKDKHSISVLKAIGFTNKDIQKQYITRSIVVVLIALILGTFFANILGELLVGIAIKAFGVSSFHFESNMFLSFVLCPLLICITAIIATICGSSDVESVNISEYIKE